MASVEPFRAVRYHLPGKDSIAKVIAPPYDIISLADQKKLQSQDPHNVIRLELSIPDPKNPPPSHVYSDSAGCLKKWLSEKILISENAKAFYLYGMEYQHPFQNKRLTRLAVYGALKLEPFEQKIVFPHEKTHSTAKVDRMKLLKETQCNFSPIFGLYEDPTDALEKIYASLKRKPALYEFVDEKKTRHQLWRLDSEADQNTIKTTFSNRGIFIADGHHRYETALNYALEKNGGVITGKHPWDYVLTAFVRFRDPGLLILPIHRLLLNTVQFEKELLLKGLNTHFHLRPATKQDLFQTAEGKNQTGFGMAFSENECYLLELKNPKAAAEMMPKSKPAVWYQLDMTQISYLILESLLQIDPSQLEKSISYTADTQEAFRFLEERKAGAAFFVRPVTAAVIKEICEAGELMPQKSTYFYPKFPTGLVMYQHRDFSEKA